MSKARDIADLNVTILDSVNQGVATTDSPTFVDVTATSLDISGDIDVDGTTNLDATNIVGALDVTGTATATFVNTGSGVAGRNAFSSGDIRVAAPNDTNISLMTVSNTLATIKTDYYGGGSLVPLVLQTGGNTNQLYLSTSGSVGIGTSSPNISGFSKALTIDSSESGIELSSSGTVHALIASNSQGANIQGIGTSGIRLFTSASGSAIERFRISSDGSLSTPTLGTSNVRFGVNAGNSIASGGTFNTLVGDGAGTAITTGDENTAIGRNSLGTATTAQYNTVVGSGAGYATTTGNSNIAMGVNALVANTTGTQNTALGTFSLDANTTASNNTAVGYKALTTNTTGANNTSVGRHALYANTTGIKNTAVGTSALIGNTTGGTNTAIGWSAGSAITTGQGNLCIGYTAGNYQASLTTGTGNVLVGPYCDAVSATADQQHCFGYNIDATSGYTTLGAGSSSIRAAFGNTTWSTVSDERYKKDIVDSTAGLSFINALQPRTWNYRTLGELPETFNAYEEGSTEVFKNTQTNHGFIAQEVKAAIDADDSIKDGFRLWDDREDGSQEVAEAALIPVLTKAIQELSAQVDALTARIETLEG